MKKFFYGFALLLAAAGMFACDKDNPSVNEQSGLNSKEVSETYNVPNNGQVITLSFDAKDSWSIVSSKAWLRLSVTTGAAGRNDVQLTVDENTATTSRSGNIRITVKGYSAEMLCSIQQGGGKEPSTLNDWINSKMDEMYLWNEAYRNIEDDLDFTLGYTNFLTMGLEAVDAQDHINIEDGGWTTNSKGETVREFFSNIYQASASKAPARKSLETRAKSNLSGFGLIPGKLIATYLDKEETQVGIGILAVYPESPAALTGIHRGMYINRINGTRLTSTNFSGLLQLVTATTGTIKLGTASISVVDEKLQIDADGPEYTLTAATFPSSVIYSSQVLTYNNEQKTKVGYICFSNFETDYDEDLLKVFQTFKEQNIDELVLDLRYNGGGAVVSSTMIATLILGDKYKDQVYAEMEYNAERTAAGKSGVYKIGNAMVPDGSGTYDLISKALNYALSLDHVYVIGSYDTASASEMVVNGLRGLDIDVRLVGQQTHGKNVAMEVMNVTSGGITYVFSPITCRTYNAKKQSDFADGFIPDLITPKESEYAVFDFGHERELMYRPILAWILNGEKPAQGSPMMAPAADGLRVRTLPLNMKTEPEVKGAYIYVDAE